MTTARVRVRLAERLRGGAGREATSTRAAAMFADESYWRDLVSFTWNIKTLEGRRGDRRHAPLPTRARAAERLRARRRGQRGRRGHRRLVRLRDRGRPRSWPRPAQGERVLDAADDDGRAQGLRGEAPHRTSQGGRARRRQGSPVVAGAQAGGRVVARLRRPAVLRDRRRRPGRHRPRRSTQAARRADDHPREELASR